MRSEKLLIVGGFCLISIIWGSTWLAIKIGLDSVPPMWGVAIRFTFAGLILAVVAMVRKKKIPTDPASLRIYALMGLMSYTVPFMLVYWGETTIPSSLASIIFCIYPFVVAALSHFLLPAERLTTHKTVGILTGFAGILVVFWEDVQPGGSGYAGMTALLVSAVLQAAALVILKKKGTHIDPMSLNLASIISGLVFMYGIAFAFEDFSTVHFDARGIGSIVYLGSFGTVVTFSTYYWLLQRVEAVYLSLSSFVTPVLAVILGTVWLGETLPSRVFWGAAVVLGGILIANIPDIARLSRSRILSQQGELSEKN
jgi:drug/metabolite transporter (DMT)-like permease